MKCFDTARLDAPANAEGLHINILEFLTLIIKLWFMLWATTCDLGALPGRWIPVDVHQQHVSSIVAAAFSSYRRSSCLSPPLIFSHSDVTPGLGKIVSSHILDKETTKQTVSHTP